MGEARHWRRGRARGKCVCEIDIPIIFEPEPYARSRNSNSLVGCGAADYRWRRTGLYIYIYIYYIYIYRVINEHADRCALDRPLAPFSDRPWSTDNLLRFKRRQPKRCGLAAKPLLLRILW